MKYITVHTESSNFERWFMLGFILAVAAFVVVMHP